MSDHAALSVVAHCARFAWMFGAARGSNVRLYRIDDPVRPKHSRRRRRLRIALTILAIAISLVATYGIQWLADALG